MIDMIDIIETTGIIDNRDYQLPKAWYLPQKLDTLVIPTKADDTAQQMATLPKGNTAKQGETPPNKGRGRPNAQGKPHIPTDDPTILLTLADSQDTQHKQMRSCRQYLKEHHEFFGANFPASSIRPSPAASRKGEGPGRVDSNGITYFELRAPHQPPLALRLQYPPIVPAPSGGWYLKVNQAVQYLSLELPSPELPPSAFSPTTRS